MLRSSALRAGSALVTLAVLTPLASACGDTKPLIRDEDRSTTGSTSTATSTGTGGGGGTGGSSGGAGGAGGAVAAPYTLTPFEATRITSDSAGPNFQRAEAEIDLRDGPFASVTLVVDLASTCYPFDEWETPPKGQNWPAECDAFDRNFEFTLDEPADPKLEPPAIELLRAITPFGGPLHTEVDLTDVANGLPGKHTLHVHIPTWSDGAGKVSGSHGGWNVTAKLVVTPGADPRKVLAVVPLWNGYQGAGEPVGPLTFTAPEGMTSSRIEYRATGHGGGEVGAGCIGPAEEFCKRKHTLKVDGQSIFSKSLWRTDCDELCTLTHQGPAGGGFDYCLENPCGAIQSVKASRANWCPGSVTPPLALGADLVQGPGEHSFSFDVSTIADGGGWRISALFLAFGD
jgi:hypothetical protein